MGLILSYKKREDFENIGKSVKTKKLTKKPKQIDAKGRRSRQKEVGEKTKRKRKVRPRAKTWEEKRCFGWGPLFFPALLAYICAMCPAAQQSPEPA
jgi:hypothetical protein